MPAIRGRSDDGRQRVGRMGERLAAEHLRNLGYRVLETNVRSKLGEVDIVALDGKTLVFVEVRTRHGGAFGTAAESITARKQQKLVRLAELYLAEHYGGADNCSATSRETTKSGGGKPEGMPACRIDVVAIALGPDNRAERIDLIRNAVEG